MNNKRKRRLSTYKLRANKLTMKELQKIKFCEMFLFSMIFAGMLSLPLAASLFKSEETIMNFGKIAATIPLHVEGRYIKDAHGNTVYLRGVNKVEFCDDPDGTWMGSTMWSDENVKAELDVMKKWGINVVRCHFSIELWKYDIGPDSGHPASPYCALSAREAIKRFVEFAAEKGIYVILDAYSVKCYWSDGKQDPLPFPPYQTSPGAAEIISSVNDFVDWWRSVARELKDYPNVMFELWNEPSPPDTRENWMIWLNAAQQCINAIREEGFNGIIFFEWSMGIYCNIYADGNFPLGVAQEGYTLHNWLREAVSNLTDPANNLAFDVHLYRFGGGTGILQGEDMQSYWNSTHAWNYSQIKMAMEYMGFKWAGETLNVSLIVGEIGCDLGWKYSNPEEYQHEITAFNNTLTILEEWNIHYTAFWWRETGAFRLHNGPPNFVPTESGQILKEKLQT